MLVKMTCPQCGASLEMDDSKDFMFCQFCGAKVAIIPERVNVTHSGSVSVDESGKLNNFRYVAQNALKSGNYGEAYNYCLRIMETDPTDLGANLYKGLAAVMQSTPAAIRTAEGVTAMNTMASMGKLIPDSLETVRTFVNQAAGMVPVLFDSQCTVKARQPLGSEQDANNVSRLAYGIVDYLTSIVAALNTDLLRVSQPLEDAKRSLILTALKLADRASASIPYVARYVAKSDSKGRTVTEPELAKARCPYKNDLDTCIRILKEDYNALPSMTSEIARLDGELKSRQQVMDDYEAALAAYFAERPDQEKAYRHPGLFGREKKRAAIEESFPEELTAQKALSEQAKKEYDQFEKQKKQFIKKNLMN
ncbi:MAG: zinc ribbon domain-containing protein [Clostridia bacterium]|nr:zinc ribbon domain-containing protein [Clostridia bacterium]